MKTYNKRNFTVENAIITSLMDYENQYESKLIFEIETDVWNVSFKYSQNKPTHTYFVFNKEVDVKHEDVFCISTKKGVLFLYLQL